MLTPRPHPNPWATQVKQVKLAIQARGKGRTEVNWAMSKRAVSYPLSLFERLPAGCRILFAAAMWLSGAMAMGDAGQPHVLRYDRPAANWTAALPIGNGRLGAMVYGNPRVERIALNEDTLYGGEPTPVGVAPIDKHVDAVFELVEVAVLPRPIDLYSRR